MAASALMRHVSRRSDAPAVITAERTLSYADLDDEVARVEPALGGERRLVAMAASNTVDCLTAYLACLRAGHVVLLAPPCRLEGLATAYQADTVVTAAGIDRRHERPRHVLHADLALLLSTSGSTGSPKLVRLSHHNLAANAAGIAASLSLGPRDRGITTLSPAYSYGLSVINSHLSVGAALVLTEGSVTEDRFWTLAHTSGVTTLPTVPFIVDLLDRRGFTGTEIPTLRLITCAGGALDPAVARRYADLGGRTGWQLALMYGATEATARMACLPPDLARTHPDAVGRPLADGSFRIADPDADGVGALYYSGPNVMMGYAHGPADLAEGPQVRELCTGDRARIGADGLLRIVGRADRFGKVFGLRLDLADVDAALRAVGIEARAVAHPDRLVVVAAHADQHRVRRVAASAAALPEHAVRAVAVAELPRGVSGKVDGAAVDRLAAGLDALAPVPEDCGGTTVDRLCVAYQSILHRPVSPSASFVSLGGDSLSYVAVSAAVEGILGTLPRRWHLLSITDLAGAASPVPGAGRQLETGLVVRALAILAVVASHAGAVDVRGGAHVLVALVGLNFARFQIESGAADLRGRLVRMGRSLAGLVVPAWFWLAVLVVTTGTYSWAVLGVTWWVQPTLDTPDWRYWFVGAVVWLLVPAVLVLRCPLVEQTRRRYPFGFPLVATVLAWSAAVAWVPDARPSELFAPLAVAWLFLFGWAAAAATTRRQTALLTVGLVVLVPLSVDGIRTLVIPAALLLVVWLRTLRLPALVVPAVVAVAEASLVIYLTHWQVLEVMSGWPAVLVSVGVGVLGVRLWSWARRPRASAPGRSRVPAPHARRVAAVGA